MSKFVCEADCCLPSLGAFFCFVCLLFGEFFFYYFASFIPHWLFLLTPVFLSSPGIAKNDATAFSTDSGEVFLQARYHELPSSLLCHTVFRTADFSTFECLLWTLGNSRKSRVHVWARMCTSVCVFVRTGICLYLYVISKYFLNEIFAVWFTKCRHWWSGNIWSMGQSVVWLSDVPAMICQLLLLME